MNHQYNLEQELPRLKLRSGDCIFQEGEVGNVAYIIDRGTVEIATVIDGIYTVLNILTAGDMFGELALVDGRPRSASAYAKTDILLTVVSNEQVRNRIDDADPILKLLLMIITNYFRSETSMLRTALADVKMNFPLNKLTPQKEQDKMLHIIELVRLESDFDRAFKQGELKPFFQPIIDLKTNLIIGFEVLLRWFSPSRGFIPPRIFIPLAESTSLIIPIGEWLFDEAIKTIEKIKIETGYEVFLSINIAKKQICDPSFLTKVKDKINHSSVKPEQIKLEILERSLFQGEIASSLVESCREFGFPLMIDDFGTGCSNLAYLTQFQFDTVKIDKFFIDNLEKNNKDQTICRTLINLSSSLQMTTVAEGIETQQQLDILLKLNCNFGQGYFFSPAVCYEDAIILINQQNS